MQWYTFINTSITLRFAYDTFRINEIIISKSINISITFAMAIDNCLQNSLKQRIYRFPDKPIGYLCSFLIHCARKYFYLFSALLLCLCLTLFNTNFPFSLPLLLFYTSHTLSSSLSLSLSVTHRTLIPFGFDFSLQAFVRFSARRMDTTAAASATARMAGRERSATSRSGSARCPIAPAMDAASRASAAASAAGRDPTAINVSVKPEMG